MFWESLNNEFFLSINQYKTPFSSVGGGATFPTIINAQSVSGSTVTGYYFAANVTGTNPALVFFIGYYEAITAQINVPFWNNSQAGMTLWGSGVWWQSSPIHSDMLAYYLLNPQTGFLTGAVTFGSIPTEAHIYFIVLNNVTGVVSPLTVRSLVVDEKIVTASGMSSPNALMFGASFYADSLWSVTGYSGENNPTQVGATVMPNSSLSSSNLSIQSGQTGIMHIGHDWGDANIGNYHGIMYGGII